MNSLDDNHIDDHVDKEIYDCIKLDNLKSFFLFAGAGSGKTRSLVNVLNKFKEKEGGKLNIYNQKVAIITYTNAACDEITRRLDYDSLFWVSTIHSFVWELIKPFQNDIREWLSIELKKQIEDLDILIAKTRRNDTLEKRKREKERKEKRLQNLSNIKVFSYNPNGDNFTRDSLNHSEVIKICATFLNEKVLMQKILVNKFPILLIDESQDTNELLIDALFKVVELETNKFSLGLFGDIMQRIYFDGKHNLGQSIPLSWAQPKKIMNHRCSERIVKLINQIRKDVDGIEQKSRIDNGEGFVRLFIVPSNATLSKITVEKAVIEKMEEVTIDEEWSYGENCIKILTLEHHLAASRMGFSNLFNPLYAQKSLKTSLLDGSLEELKFFSNIIIPIVNANSVKNDFEIYRIVKQYSPYFYIENLMNQKSQIEIIKKVKKLINDLLKLWDNSNPTLLSILQYCEKSKLFELPEIYEKILIEINKDDFSEENIVDDELLFAWYNALNNDYKEIELYNSYISDNANFGTHQGVKGLEFPRVMVILDDEEAKGFMFSYEKLFGAKELTATDIKNRDEGKDSSIDRTRRLFYVTCSRAEKSLAIVAYTKAPQKVQEQVLLNHWFEKEEIMIYKNNNFFKIE